MIGMPVNSLEECAVCDSEAHDTSVGTFVHQFEREAKKLELTICGDCKEALRSRRCDMCGRTTDNKPRNAGLEFRDETYQNVEFRDLLCDTCWTALEPDTETADEFSGPETGPVTGD